ncbi:hypothetical protein CPB86DRAFT_738181, partial [Serendipita vermifera]
MGVRDYLKWPISGVLINLNLYLVISLYVVIWNGNRIVTHVHLLSNPQANVRDHFQYSVIAFSCLFLASPRSSGSMSLLRVKGCPLTHVQLVLGHQ